MLYKDLINNMEPLRDNADRSRFANGQHDSTRTSQHLHKICLKSTIKFACVTLHTGRLEKVSLYNCYCVLNSGAV
jgi:hypothetical protein